MGEAWDLVVLVVGLVLVFGSAILAGYLSDRHTRRQFQQCDWEAKMAAREWEARLGPEDPPDPEPKS